MKPDPLPPSRALTPVEALLLEVSAAGGAHPMRPKGVSEWAAARRLVKLGLGEIEANTFCANERGVWAVRKKGDG